MRSCFILMFGQWPTGDPSIDLHTRKQLDIEYAMPVGPGRRQGPRARYAMVVSYGLLTAGLHACQDD